VASGPFPRLSIYQKCFLMRIPNYLKYIGDTFLSSYRFVYLFCKEDYKLPAMFWHKVYESISLNFLYVWSYETLIMFALLLEEGSQHCFVGRLNLVYLSLQIGYVARHSYSYLVLASFGSTPTIKTCETCIFDSEVDTRPNILPLG
jgi:hypothetical protein